VKGLLVLLTLPALAQNLTLGVKGALRLTGMPDAYGAAESRPYRVGPAVELGLPLGFALEADALYSRLGYSIDSHHIGVRYNDRVRANAWEFPVLAKYHAALPLRPSIFFGISPRHASVRVDSFSEWTLGTTTITSSTTTSRAKDHAWVFGGGLELAAGYLRVAPEIRFLHTNVPQYPTPWNLASYLPLPSNEAAIFLGLGRSVHQ
jgi:hypothetical protein